MIVVDLGNSAIKLGRPKYQPDARARGPTAPAISTWESDFPIARISIREPDWIEQVSLLVGNASPHSWRVASVNRPAYDRWRTWIAQARPTDQIQVITHQTIPLKKDVANVAQVGIDRLVAAWAAYRLVGNSGTVVVDAGSATTIDLVDSQGTFRGGAILPGLRLQIHALATGTDALTEIQLGEPMHGPLFPGKETASAIRIGVHAAVIGAIEVLAERYQELDQAELPLVLTGGDASYLANLLWLSPKNDLTNPLTSASGNTLPRPRLHVVPSLILQGLANLPQTE